MSNIGLERKVVWLAALIQLANLLDYMIILPLGPDLMTGIGIPSSDMGYLGAAFTLSAAISGILFAPILDRFDRKKAAIFFLTGLAISTALCGLAFDTVSMLGGRLLAGVFGGPITALSMSMVIDVVPIERRGRSIALISGAWAIASIFGIPVALKLAELGGWQLSFFAVAGFAMFIVICALILLPSLTGHFEDQEVKQKRIPLKPMFRFTEVRLSLSIAAILSFSQFMLIAGTINYFVFNLGFPRDDLDFLYFVGGGLSFAIMLIAGRLVDRFGVRILSFITAIFYSLILMDGYLHQPIMGVFAVFTLFMIFAAILSVITGSISSEVPRDQERAAFMSLHTTTKLIFGGMGSFMAGLVLTTNLDGSVNNIDILAVVTIGCIIILPFLLVKLRRSLNARTE